MVEIEKTQRGQELLSPTMYTSLWPEVGVAIKCVCVCVCVCSECMCASGSKKAFNVAFDICF